MNTNDIVHLKVHQIFPEGICTSLKFEIDIEDQIVSNTLINLSENQTETVIWQMDVNDTNLHLKHLTIKSEDSEIRLIKVENSNELDQINTETVTNASQNFSDEKYVFTTSNKQQNYYLKLPDATVISCQNCDTTFPTKYQYQRHQCEFNAAKVVLKPEIIGKDIDKATRLRFECETCKKSFVSNNNLERHRTCHTTDKLNVCEYCKKTFVSENRLKIHKENHCKKAGDMTKFYRSDVVVWQCNNCKQVFATQSNGMKHVENCTIFMNIDDKSLINSEISENPQNEDETSLNVSKNNNFDENFEIAIKNQDDDINLVQDLSVPKLSKVVTEILYQCEFCNQTYISKSTLLEHQNSHTTEKNYECTFCDKYFNSYTVATIHWQNKCTEESNLFYLPKLVYCEHCDRGFKSHEILYNHKNKKKHFSPKLHEKRVAESTDEKNENAIVKLIESMITKMDKKDINTQSQDKNIDDNKENELDNVKKRRGRKRKWQKRQGYMYQCERCSVVFKDIANLDAHKNTQHTSVYSCGQCGQVCFII